MSELPYRPGVGILLLNQEGKIFVGKRIDMVSEAWQMPQGGIDPGEEPLEAAMREMKEEIGTNQAELLRESNDWLTYDLPVELVQKLWNGRYRGQRQKWFALRFTGKDSDINLQTKEPEFCQWRWVTPAELPELIVSFKRDLYRALVKEFADLLDEKKPRSKNPVAL